MSWLRLIVVLSLGLFAFLLGLLYGNYTHLLQIEVCKSLQSKYAPKLLEDHPPAKYTPSIRHFLLTLNPFYKSLNKIKQPKALTEVFSMFHHPSSPLTSEILLRARNVTFAPVQQNLYQDCQSVYLTRTGSLANMPNKCLSIVLGSPIDIDPVPHYHRRGKIAGMVNMFQSDYIKHGSLRTEKLLLSLFVEHLEEVTQQFLKVAGPPLREDGERRSIMVMVLNEGVIDVFFNFVCSCRAAGISEIFDSLIVILGQDHLVDVIEKMGVKAFYSPHLGPIPKKAADFYGDLTFGILMWFKVTSVYLAYRAGFNVLFQVRQ